MTHAVRELLHAGQKKNVTDVAEVQMHGFDLLYAAYSTLFIADKSIIFASASVAHAASVKSPDLYNKTQNMPSMIH